MKLAEKNVERKTEKEKEKVEAFGQNCIKLNRRYLIVGLFGSFFLRAKKMEVDPTDLKNFLNTSE